MSRTVGRSLAIAVLIGLCALPISVAGALASDPAPFSQAAFAAAQKAGAQVLVDVRAPWCPICKRQAPLLAKLLADPRFRNVQRFDVDFDTQKEALRALGIQMQSTLVVFKAGKEVGRSVGQTQAEWLEDLLEKVL